MDIFGFLHLSFVDVIDVLAVALIIYFIFRWIRESAAVNIFFAIILLLVMQVIASALDMKLMSKLLNTFIDVGAIALIVIFQPEIRHFLIKFGNNSNTVRHGRKLLDKLLGITDKTIGSVELEELKTAVGQMSDSRTGALIVIARHDSLNSVIETGDALDAGVQSRLLLNLFFKNSPLHDGAVIISGSRIVAARCTLPITSRTDIPAEYGMRHKAAIGITEDTDAQVIVVSEETGHISWVENGEIRRVRGSGELDALLSGNKPDGESGNQ